MENSQRPKHTPPPGKRLTIAFLTAQIIDTNGIDLWHGVADAARQSQVNLICLVGDELQVPLGFRAQANVLYEFVSAEQIDGLVIWGSTFSNYLDITALAQFCERHRALPMVTVATPLPGIPCVFLDNYQAMYNAMVHLIDVHQHTRIACIRGPQGSPEANERYRAYLDALRDHNLPFDPALVESADYWNKPFGTKAIQAILARPGMPLQAVVAASDTLAIDAMSALQAQGLRVPGDVAVIGFDNAREGRYTTPPLTSVPIRFYAQGYRAVEMLLHGLAGAPVPEQVVLSADIIVRQSCGCVNPIVTQAAVGRVTVTGESLPTVAAARQAAFLHDLTQAITSSPAEQVRAGGMRVLDAFVAEMQGQAGGAFLAALDEVLCQAQGRQGNLGDWQSLIAILRRHTLPALGAADELARADDLWQQAQVLIGQMMQRAQAYQAVLAEQSAQALRELEAALITTFDLNALMSVLAEGLPRLGIPGCALALYDDPQRPTDDALCLLAYNAQGDLDLPPHVKRFPARQLVPRGFLPQARPAHLVVEALYFQEHQIGFIVFEPGPPDGKIYEILRGQISTALQGALLVQRVQQRSAELAQKQYILDTFMANVPDAIYFKDRDSRMIQVNQALATRFGVNDPVRMIGKTDFDFFPEAQAQSKFTVEQDIIRTGQPVLNLEEPDAGGGWSLTTKMPLRNEHGAIIGTFGISRDITALKQTQATLEAVNKELQDFAYVTSHDLKAPLRAIAHLAYWLADDYGAALDNKGREMTVLLVGRVKRLDDLIEGILQYSRIGRIEVEEEPVELRHLVPAVIDSLSVPDHIQVRVDRALPIVHCNMTRMTQVFQNLIGNAVKFLDKPQGVITISCQDHDQTWLFRVTDNGPGIETRYQERIFRIFQTLAPRDQHESTGIGLTLVKKIVESYGGEIWVESTVGEGSTFFFTLPKT